MSSRGHPPPAGIWTGLSRLREPTLAYLLMPTTLRSRFLETRDPSAQTGRADVGCVSRVMPIGGGFCSFFPLPETPTKAKPHSPAEHGARSTERLKIQDPQEGRGVGDQSRWPITSVWMEGDEDDHPCPESIVLSQTCWEYKTLLGEEQQSAPHVAVGSRAEQATRSIAPKPRRGVAAADINRSLSRPSKHSKCKRRSSKDHGEQPRLKQSKTSPMSTDTAQSCPGTTALRTIRLEGKGDDDSTRTAGSWDVFVLVLQASGLQRITSKRGSELDFGTLLIADQSLSFFRLTLWGKTARAAGRLVRAGDLVRFNGIGVSSFRGTVQATSTRSTSFRVVWRGDAFTTPQDAPGTTMLAHGWSVSRASGDRGRFDPGPVLSQDDELRVSREAGCALAAWAKSEFPSVTSSEPYGQEQKQRRHRQAMDVVEGATGDDGGGGDGPRACSALSGAGSLGAVRKGVETTVRACVLEVSHVERLWVWESSGGKRRKDLVSRATALLTDGLHEMTLQLWGDMASDATISILREGAETTTASATAAAAAASIGPEGVAAAAGSPGEGRERQRRVHAAVFEFTRLQPSFSFSCEALVLNGKSGTVRRMEFDSAEACSVSEAVLAAAAGAVGAVAGADDRTVATARPSQEERRYHRAPASFFPMRHLTGAGEAGAAPVRRFESVAALLSADGFSGAGHLGNVVVRKVDAPCLLAPEPSPPHSGGHHRNESTSASSALRGGGGTAPLSLAVFIGDPEDSSPMKSVGGGRSVLRATAEGGALRDMMSCVPGDFLALGGGGHRGGSADATGAAARVARSLLDGLQVGGQHGETVHVVLAVRASVDSNGRVIPGGSSYRIVSLRPNCCLEGDLENCDSWGRGGAER